MSKVCKLLGGLCASGLMISGAHAGVLDIQVVNVNTGAPNQMDMNGIAGPTGTLNQDNPDEVTVEEPLFFTNHRDISDVKPMRMHVEIEAYDIEGLPTFSGDEIYLVEINLLGSANPVFKTDISQAAIVRPGTDAEFSEAAEGFPAGDIIHTGDNSTQFFLTPAEVSETAIGFVLPVELQACGDFDVEISFTTFVGNLQNTRTVSTANKVNRVASCVGPAFTATAFTPDDLLVDVGTVSDPFELFLIPDGISGKGFQTVNMVEFGLVNMSIRNYVFNPKEKNEDNGGDVQERLVDVTDIATYTLQYTFEGGLDGIGSLEMVGCGEQAFLSGNTATWTLTGAEVQSCFGIAPPLGPDYAVQSGEVLLKIMSNQLESINTQKITLSRHDIDFIDRVGEHMFLSGLFSLQDRLEDAWRIIRNGLNFGPYDWVAEPGKKVQSVFRVTGIPADAGYTRGIVFVENTQNTLDGFCEFDLAPWVVNGEVVINPDKFGSIISSPMCFRDGVGMGSLEGYGRGDITWSFFIPSPDGDKVDVDRLLWSPGDNFADYGDNGNDAFSLKARSCDPGRFGGHTVNNLSGEQADLLLFLCRTGDFVTDAL